MATTALMSSTSSVAKAKRCHQACEPWRVASRDGLPLASTFPAAEAPRVAAMAASVVGLAEEILADAGAGTSTTIVRGAAGCLVVHPAGAGAVVAARTGANPNLGLVHLVLPATVAALTRSLEPC